MDNLNKVLTACNELAKRGGNINVFDLMYETSLAYPALKCILDRLVFENELEEIDIKTYRYTGELKRFEEDPFDAGLACLEERRQELIARMRAEEEEDESDRKFAEYEKFLRDNLDGVDEDDDGKEASDKNGQEGLVEFMKDLLRDECANRPWEEIPEHPSWVNDNDFMMVCAEKLKGIVNSDKRTGRLGALKKASFLLGRMKANKNKPMIEVYACIVFVLGNMSNYYYIKIREGLI